MVHEQRLEEIQDVLLPDHSFPEQFLLVVADLLLEPFVFQGVGLPVRIAHGAHEFFLVGEMIDRVLPELAETGGNPPGVAYETGFTSASEKGDEIARDGPGQGRTDRA